MTARPADAKVISFTEFTMEAMQRCIDILQEENKKMRAEISKLKGEMNVLATRGEQPW